MSSFGNTTCPELIIIAIPNTNRYRDLTPFDPANDKIDSSGIEQFSLFLESELIPYIDKSYKTLQHRTLIGHSLAGSFVLNTLINHQNLFTNYLAIDPGLKLHDYRFFDYAIEKIRNNSFKNKSLFMTVANTMPEAMDTLSVLTDTSWTTSTIRSNLKFAKDVKKCTNNELNYQWKYYTNENHLSIPTISEYDGLKHFFRWNVLDLDKIIRTDPDIAGESFFNRVTGHYRMVTEKLGFKTLPDHEQMNDLGNYYMQKEDFEAALLFFHFNIENYPNNSKSYDSMGHYFLARKQSAKATQMFKKANEINDIP